MEERVGIVTIRDGRTAGGRDYWQIEYRCPAAYSGDPNKGKQVRRRIRKDEMDLAKVRELADHLTAQAYQGKGYLAQPVRSAAPTINDGIVTAIKLTNTRPHVTKERVRLAAQFVRWLAIAHPEVKTWDQMRPSMLQGYVLDLERQGKAFDTVRLAAAPIKLAWRQMAEDYPDLVRPVPKIRQKPSPKKDMQTLTTPEMAILLDWLKAKRPDLWPIAVLQALAGLRLLEAAALRRRDVDLDAKTLHVTDTERHAVKTQTSDRTIPLCDEVVEALRMAIAAQKVIPPGGEIFVNKRGSPWTKDALVWKWNRIKKRIDPHTKRPAIVEETGHPALAHVQAHRLRSFFATTAARLGAEDRAIQAYIGHAAKDVLGKHYLKIGMNQLAQVAETIGRWRKESAAQARLRQTRVVQQ